ncbi:T9SS type A sorting domain-containing protein [Bacteroidota bacterium]
MKKQFKYIYLILFLILFVRAQEPSAGGELIILIENNPSYKEVKIDVDLISPLCWDSEDPASNNIHDLTTDYPGSYQTKITNGSSLEWEACWGQQPATHSFALGNYRVRAYVKQDGAFHLKDQFEIDYRTSDLHENFNGDEDSGDFPVDFDVSKNRFYYRASSTPVPSATTIWDEKEWIDNLTVELEPLPPTNLTQTASYGSPQLQWQHADVTPNWRTGYKIYRSLNSQSNFSVIATTTYSVNTYTDIGLILNGGGTAYYKVTAVNDTRESVYSNTIDVSIVEIGKINQLANQTIGAEYKLEQNYPNPFNPVTVIRFSLKDNSFVTLKVFDILGTEIEVIINKVLSAGNHQVQFDGSNIESGIYFYEIRANEFRDVNKFILIK